MTRRLVALTLAPALVALLAPIAVRTQEPPTSAASAAITGRIVTADTGAPIRGAQVRLRSGSDVRLAITDEQGVFEARDLFAGAWAVVTSKNGFVTERYGQRRGSDVGTPISVNNGQHVQVSIALLRAAAITGRIFDEFGEPLLGARVQATRSRIVAGVRQLAAAASATTDDTGAFRLFGLAPGSYVVTVSLRASAPDQDVLQGSVGALTYYPGTANVSEAQPVSVRAGEEPGIAFAVTPIRSVRISGTVLAASGAPAADCEVRLQRFDATEVGTTVGNFGRTGPDGAFSIINVPPGAYVLSASRPGNGSYGEETVLPLTVGTDDVAGIAVAMMPPATVTGTIVGDGLTSLPDTLHMAITAFPFGGVINRRPLVSELTRRRGEPMTFSLPGMFGPLRLGVQGLPDTLMLQGIEADGADVADAAFDPQRTRRVRIVLTSRVTEISGTVMSGDRPAPDATVIIFSDDRARWTYPTRYVATATTDGDGRFSIRRLPPGGRYLAAAIGGLDEGDEFDPEMLERLRDRAAAVTLGDGDRRTVALALDR